MILGMCRSVGKRIKSALLWMVTTAIVCALVLGILYGTFCWSCWLFLFYFLFSVVLSLLFCFVFVCEVGVRW